MAELKNAADAVEEVNAKINFAFENANALNLTLFEVRFERNLKSSSLDIAPFFFLEFTLVFYSCTWAVGFLFVFAFDKWPFTVFSPGLRMNRSWKI